MNRPLLQSLCLLFLCASAAQTPTASQTVKAGLKKPDPAVLYLYEKDHKVGQPLAVDAAKPLLSHRVYLRYDNELHTWVYEKTGFDGQFSLPREYLRPGSVAPGSVIGAKLALERFLLQPDGQWTPTLLREQYKVWIKKNPPELKVLTYAYPIPPDSQRVPANQVESGPKTQIK